MVEGTPLLREHTPKKCIEGSNPSLSAKYDKWAVLCFLTLYSCSDLRCAISEPSTLVLLTLGILGVLAHRWRRWIRKG